MLAMPLALARAMPALLLFGAALVVGLELARPFRAASIAYDSQAAVLYFDRIVTGRQLEDFVPTTSKPLLTALFGPLFAVSHDWRALAWLTLAVEALAVTLAAGLAWRIGGPVSGVFVGVALANNAGLLFDVGYALATPYALAAWALAGLALSGPRPRYALAGIALAIAALARIETLVVIAATTLGLAATWLWHARRRLPPPPARAWLVPVLGALAVPIIAVHDQLLAGDPLLWTKVSAIYTERTAQHVPTAFEVVQALVGRYWGMGALSLLAAIGIVRLLAAGRPWPAYVLVAQIAGIGLFLVSIAARHIYVTIRYATTIDVGVIFAAGLGLAVIGIAVGEWPPLARVMGWLRDRAPRATGALAIAAVALLLTGPYTRQNPELRTVVRASLETAAASDRALSALAEGMDQPCADATTSPRLIAHGSIRPRLAVELGRPLQDIIGLTPQALDAALDAPVPCAVILHVRAADGERPGWAVLELSEPHDVDGVRFEPLLADPTAGLWVVSVRR
jgi:hypothetical protein